MQKALSRALGMVEALPPGSFAFVMATGIVAIACHLHAIPVVPEVLGAIGWAGYCLLAALMLLRLVLFPGAVIWDFADHMRGPGFLTIVAGTSVLGAQTLAIEHSAPVATILWLATAGLWLLILYSLLTAMAVTERNPPLGSAINGGWLLTVVATQSVVVLGGAVGADIVPPAGLQFVGLAVFLAGGLLYLMTITLIFYRITFLPLTPESFGPLYWIDTGGAAISVLAGATLLLRAGSWPVIGHYEPFIAGMTVFFWAAASFWLPFLVAMMAWRYLIRRDRLAYEPGLWGMVFPLGMYATATFQLAKAERFDFLEPLSLVFAFVGLGMWLVTFGAFLTSLRR